MEKQRYIFVLMLLFMSSFVLAEITISEPYDVYNLGDRLYVSAEGLIGADSGNLNIDLVCGNSTVNLEKMSARRYDSKEEFPYSLPYKVLNSEDLEVENITDILGDCQISLTLGTNEAVTKTFIISDEVKIAASLNKTSYNPGETISLEIEAVKANGVKFTGFIEVSNATSFTKEIKEGVVSEVFSMPETIEAGTYYLDIRAYDEKGNEGFNKISFKINQVASSLIMSLSDVNVVPGNDFVLGAEVFDQSGIKMDGTVSVKIISPKEEKTELTIQSGKFKTLEIASNSTAGPWKIISTFNGITEESEFEMMGLQKVSFDIEGSVLSVTNTGNTKYNKTIDVTVGEETMKLELNIEVGEIRKFNIGAPSGGYEVVVNDGESSISKQVLLTGNSISISDLGGGILGNYAVAWIFLIVLMALVGTAFYLKYKKKKNTSVISSDIAKQSLIDKTKEKFKSIGKTSSQKSEKVMDLTSKKTGTAESTLVLKGDKYLSAVLSINVKNYETLNESAKKTLHDEIIEKHKQKGLVDWHGDHIFLVFSPLITKTYNNEIMAANSGMNILKDLEACNKKFSDKIEFNIGIHSGELVASKEGDKLKYTSIGNTISMARRISDSDSGKLIVSEPVQKRLLRDVKTTKGKEIGKINTYEISEIRDKIADAARLKDLLKRSS